MSAPDTVGTAKSDDAENQPSDKETSGSATTEPSTSNAAADAAPPTAGNESTVSSQGSATDSSATATDGPQPVADEADGQAAPQPTGRAQRRSRWASSRDAYWRLNELSAMPRSKFRESDRVTAALLTISVSLLCIMLVIPLTMAIPVVLVADVMLFTTLVFFLANRFGILTHLADRDAVLVADLMTGMLLLGLLFAGNIGCVMVLFMAFFR